MEDIKCFQHCTRDYNILCFNIPELCPLCGLNVLASGMKIPPYLIPQPFTSAENTACSMLIKPTAGDFLTDFTNDSNLHVGLTDSEGRVYEYDEHGVTIGSCEWTQCLSVELDLGQEIMNSQWNECLQKFKDGRLWKVEHYDEERHNCFDFVVVFLRYIGLDRVYSSLIDRGMFCQEIIVPRTEKIGRYITLYRDVTTHGCVIKPSKIE